MRNQNPHQGRALTGAGRSARLILRCCTPTVTQFLGVRHPAGSWKVSLPVPATPGCAPHSNPSGPRAEREKGGRGRTPKQPISVWLPKGKAAPGGLDQRAGGHREKIAEGRNQSYVGSITGKPPSCHGGTGAGCLRLTTLVNLCGANDEEASESQNTRTEAEGGSWSEVCSVRLTEGDLRTGRWAVSVLRDRGINGGV